MPQQETEGPINAGFFNHACLASRVFDKNLDKIKNISIKSLIRPGAGTEAEGQPPKKERRPKRAPFLLKVVGAT